MRRRSYDAFNAREDPRVDYRSQGLKNFLRFAKNAPNPSLREQMTGDDKHSSVAGQVKAGNRPKNLFKKTSIVQKVKRAWKASAATDTDKIEASGRRG